MVDSVGSIWIAPGTNKTRWFVENDINWRTLMNQFAIDLNVIDRRGLKVKIPTRFSIHRYATGCD